MGRASNKQEFDRTRLTWVLAALVASMTVGTVVLGVLEPHKIISSKVKYLAATYNTPSSEKITHTNIPIESNRWRAIVIHVVDKSLRLKCLEDNTYNSDIVHFAISPSAEILITTKWVSQEPVREYPKTIHIGIELKRNHKDATLTQAQVLVSLIRDLQARCNIPASRVYLHSQISSHSCCKNPLYRFNWRKVLLD